MKDLPRERRCPTPTAEHLVPVPFHEAIYPVEGSPVAGEPIVGVVATKGLVEPADLVLERPVPHIAHELPEIGHSAAKSRLLRLSANLVVAFAIARAVVGKPKNENVSVRLPCTRASRCANRPNLTSLVLLGSKASANLFSRLLRTV